ncbi:MAG: AMP-dependent synthetase and ligase [Verrucomicrobia bacterium]|nr:AMP-dependent synthetase and ligase [Verrucomicrobiota bacterium]
MPALKVPRGRTRSGAIDYLVLTFAELDAEVSAWGAKLARAGVRAGDRTLVLVKPGLPLIASIFALFRAGAVPVVIDPGMGLGNFLSCVARSRPRALVGVPFAQWSSHVFRGAFRTVEVRVPVPGSPTAELRHQEEPENSITHVAAPEDLAAILFTSGSTGAPKGVLYEHGMFEAQVRLIRSTYSIEPGEVDLPMLPIFALFNPALGMTTIVPEIDPRRPAEVDPAKIVQAINQEGVTNSFGSPTLWLRISDYCARHGTKLPTLRRVLSAGAPVPSALWSNAPAFLPNGFLHSPYGATEALPVATIRSDAVDPQSTRGACLGKPVDEVRVKIIALGETPIATLDQARELGPGEIGEIIVKGPVVTKNYDDQPAATAAAKIFDGGGIWHRMGDCGFRDEAGSLWFVGRKAERVKTESAVLFTEPCEQVFRQHPRVGRCALVGVGEPGRQIPALVVESESLGASDARQFAGELRALARQHPHTSAVSRFYFRPRFPVDVRHNAKIHRLALARWAAKAPGIEATP